MRIYVHIGPDAACATRLQQVMDSKRGAMAQKGVLFARSPNAKNHTRLFMAVTDADSVDVLRFNRGFMAADKQEQLAREVALRLRAEVEQAKPDTLILSAHQLGTTLATETELARLRAMLLPLSEDIRIVAHVEDPARMLVRRYAAQVLEGRARSLAVELSQIEAPDWWNACLDRRPVANPRIGMFPDVQGPAHWLDFEGLVRRWDAVFGEGATRLYALDPDVLWSESVPDMIAQAFDLDIPLGKADPAPIPVLPADAWITRMRQFNDVLIRLIAKDGLVLPRQAWARLLGELAVDGPAPEAGALHAISDRFAASVPRLLAAHAGLTQKAMSPDAPRPAPWAETDPTLGFRPTQYLAAFRFRINKAAKDAAEAMAAPDIAVEDELSPMAREIFPEIAKQKYAQLRQGTFAPHNRIGTTDDEADAPPYTPIAPRSLPEGRTGTVIVGCMKNEAPYIVEWVAYHRAIGIDTFIIYTNGCEDSTDPILKRLEEMGIVHHRNNEDWTGKSPQQFALDNAIKDPVVRNADWIAHIDVDEYINVRCDNGTIQDFLARVPDATNVAMTWRLFGHGGVTRFEDKPVIGQFETCAPKYCPKPHTVWGFKTMFRNIGAYGKLSCHRPNKLDPEKAGDVRWVNGSGQDMTGEAIKNGWRNSKRSIGYDLLQLNHYALRSAESFLVKRQRGRALHVDRSIGLNYWIRMDWNDARDTTIQRNLPRMQAEYDRLMQDDILRGHHEAGVAWHRAKARSLHETPEFEELYQQAVALRLTHTERAAYALALDLES